MAEKKRRAQYVIENNRGLAELERSVARLLAEIDPA
jgi:hypothetical protein